MRIIKDTKLDFNNVLLLPRLTTISSRKKVNLCRTFMFNNIKWSGVPIVASNMDTIGNLDVHNVLKKHECLTALHKFHNPKDFQNDYDPNYLMISVGMNEYDKLSELMKTVDTPWICLDVANGYMEEFGIFCRKIRELYPNKIIVAGNVCTPEGVEFLVSNGVNIVKTGIGSGSGCLTRAKTGIGMPQLSTIIECAEKAHQMNAYIMADGGITCPGDLVKAFCAGADFTMIGGQFAGHDENPGEIIEENGTVYKLFYGMSSDFAMQKHFGKMEKYRTSEGRVLKIPYKGPIEHTLQDYLGGLRSAGTYLNAHSLELFPTNATFIQVTQQLNKSLVQ